MTKYKKEFGSSGEMYAAFYLQEKGYKIIEKNASSRWGEIDLVTTKNGKRIFIEVKTRRNIKYGKPYEAVNYSKLKKLKRSIDYYILINKLAKVKCQLDVVGIIMGESGHVYEIKHYENIIF